MSIPLRKYANTRSFEWDEQMLTLEFRSDSSMRPFSEECRIGHASVNFVLVVPNAARGVDNRFQWFPMLRAFENFQSTDAWQGITDHVNGAAQLSQAAREFILRAVRAEVDNAYAKTVLLKHIVMAVRVCVRVRKLIPKIEAIDNDEEDEVEEEGSSERTIKWRRKMRGRRWDTCGLCGEGLPKQELMLGCSHAFHLKCYYRWRERSQDCPACGPKIQ